MSRQSQFLPGHVGGRVASAQPVNRVRSVAAAAPPIALPVTEPAHRGSYLNQGVQVAGAVDLQDDYWLPSFTPAAGDVAVTFFAAVRATPSLPTGWTSLASGTGGSDLGYVCGYRTLTGSDSWSASVSPTWTSGSPYTGYVDAMTIVFTSPNGLPAVSVTEKDTSSFCYADTGSPGVGLSHWWLLCRSVETGAATSPSTVPSGGEAFPDIIAMISGGQDGIPGDQSGAWAGCGYACDWATFTLGWV